MRKIPFLAALAVLVASAAGASAADTYMEYIGADNTNYDVATNWQEVGGTAQRVPASGVYDEGAYIRNGSTVTLDSMVPEIYELWVGGAYDPNLSTPPASELHVLSGAELIAYNSFNVGSGYEGMVRQTGGSIALGADLLVGNGGGNGTYNMAGGELTVDFGGYGARIGYGDTAGLSQGTFNMSDGYVDLVGGTTTRVGLNNGDPNNAVVGVFNQSGGEFWSLPTIAERFYVGSGPNATGVMNVSGGTWYNNSSLQAGDEKGGVGYINVSQADPNVPTYVSIGGGGGIGSLNLGHAGPAMGPTDNVSRGYFTQTGGSTSIASTWLIGWGGYGEVNISGGSINCEPGGEDPAIGRAEVMATGYLSPGEGTFNMSGGYFRMGGNRKLKIGAGEYTGSQFDPNSPRAAGVGIMNITGGKFEIDRAESGQYSAAVEIGHLAYSHSYGELNLLGGSFEANDTVVVASWNACTGVLRVNKDAYVYMNDLEMRSTFERVAKLIIDLDAEGNGFLNLGGAILAGTLDVQTGGYRPKEGDKFQIIKSYGYTNDFEVFDSNIANGLQADPSDPNVTLPAFGGSIDANDYRAYMLTFQGLTWGDANGDHAVDGGDLALMGGNWMQGSSGPFPGDCNHDTSVDGGDLAIMGGNWMNTSGTMAWEDGDFTGDGNVDGGDLALMGGNWMQTAPSLAWADGDFNGDGKVDGGDLALLGGAWMWTLPTPAPGQAIPEPATLALLAMGGLAVVRRRR